MLPTDSNNKKPSILKTTREAKGLTLEIVHEATKIPMDALKAIEEGYTVRILSPFYYRGFIKIYAEFLDLDVGEMYKQYGLDEAPQATSSATVSVKKPAVRETGPNMFLEQMQEAFSFLVKPKTLKLILKVMAFLILLLLLVRMAGCVASHMNKKRVSPKKQSVFFQPENKVAIPKDVDEKRTVAAPPVVQHESVQVQSEDDKVEVAVRAIKDTWIQVKADDRVVFQMTLSKGSMESWSADKRIQLSGRNIEQLDMEVNGKHVGSLGGGERRIRRVLITKQGLTVKR
jgi:cytoskeletal protein RodZ